jgi:hypothetical protein
VRIGTPEAARQTGRPFAVPHVVPPGHVIVHGGGGGAPEDVLELELELEELELEVEPGLPLEDEVPVPGPPEDVPDVSVGAGLDDEHAARATSTGTRQDARVAWRMVSSRFVVGRA